MLQNGQYYLLTHWGTLLDYDPDTNKTSLQSSFDRPPRLAITIIGDKTRFQYLSKNNFWMPLYVDTDGRLKADPQRALETPRKNPVDAHFTHAPPSYRQFTMNGLFLSAESDDEIRFSKTQGDSWETFRILPENHLSALQFFYENKWYIASKQKVIDGRSLEINESFRIKIDEFDVDAEEIIENINSKNFNNFFVHHSEWMPENFILYKPVVYYCCFGAEDGFKCLDISIESLRRYAGYDGDIVILSDRTREELEKEYKNIRDEKITLLQFTPFDYIDYMSARFEIHNYTQFSTYQPILYLDTDVIIQSPLTEMLISSLSNQQAGIHVFKETDHPESATYWGKELFKDDADIASPPTYGFSTGVMLYRNLSSVEPASRLIRGTIFRQGKKYGTRNMMRCFDQPVANYIIHKFNMAEPYLLTKHTQNFDLSYKNANNESYNSYASGIKTPLLHFAGGVGAYHWKLNAMQRHMTWLKEHNNLTKTEDNTPH